MKRSHLLLASASIGAALLAYYLYSRSQSSSKPHTKSSRKQNSRSKTAVNSSSSEMSAEQNKQVDSDDENVTTSETVHVLKQNKTDGIKSSYYHFSSTPAAEAERYKPQLITDPSQMPAVSPPPQIIGGVSGSLTGAPSTSTVTAAAPQAIGGSRWNAAGTWEDKDVSQWAHDRFKEMIQAIELPHIGAKVTGFERISGDCTIIFSRGKKRHGYDIAALANFTAKLAEGPTIKGTLEFPEIADSVADEPWQVLISIKDPTNETKKTAEVVYDAWKAHVPTIRKSIDQWVAEFKKHDG